MPAEMPEPAIAIGLDHFNDLFLVFIPFVSFSYLTELVSAIRNCGIEY